MYYINSAPTENGNYGNPQSNGGEDMLALPDELLPDYIGSMGFVVPTVDDTGLITAVERNEAAYSAYQEAHPPQPEPEPVPTADELLDALLGAEVTA